MKKLILALSIIWLAACSKTSDNINNNVPKNDDLTITFALEATFPPYEYFDANNNIVGFDIDLAQAICTEINAICSFKHQAFDSLIPDLINNRIDAVISGLDVTPERKKQIAFTNPYIENSATLITKINNVTNKQLSLDGKNIGVQNGTTHQRFLEDTFGTKVKIKSYDSYQNAIIDLQSGRLDYVFSDTEVVNVFLKQESNLAKVDKTYTDPNYFGIGMAIAVNKNNIELLEKFNNALTTIKNNGKYDSIKAKWLN